MCIRDRCNIGHDVQLGENVTVGLATSISGHSNIGDNVKIGPGCTLNNRSNVADNSTIGIGSLLLHKVHPGVVVLGRPAVPRDEYLSREKKLRSILGDIRSSRKITKHSLFNIRTLRRILKRLFVRQ